MLVLVSNLPWYVYIAIVSTSNRNTPNELTWRLIKYTKFTCIIRSDIRFRNMNTCVFLLQYTIKYLYAELCIDHYHQIAFTFLANTAIFIFLASRYFESELLYCFYIKIILSIYFPISWFLKVLLSRNTE